MEGNGESSGSWWLLNFGRKDYESESLLILSAAASLQLRCVLMSVYVCENENERRGVGGLTHLGCLGNKHSRSSYKHNSL